MTGEGAKTCIWLGTLAPSTRRHKVVFALALTGCLAAAGCSSGAGSGATSTSTTTASRHLLVATEADNGGILYVQPGDRLKVVLPSSAWAFQPSQYPRIVNQTSGGGVTQATPTCHAGTGCGTVTRYFKMGKKGNAVLSAVCTQQALCAGQPMSFSLRLDVS